MNARKQRAAIPSPSKSAPTKKVMTIRRKNSLVITQLSVDSFGIFSLLLNPVNEGANGSAERCVLHADDAEPHLFLMARPNCFQASPISGVGAGVLRRRLRSAGAFETLLKGVEFPVIVNDGDKGSTVGSVALDPREANVGVAMVLLAVTHRHDHGSGFPTLKALIGAPLHAG